MSPVVMHHFQPVVYDGKIYVLGALTGSGRGEPPLPDVYIYDPAADRWEKGPAVPTDRLRGGAGVTVYNDLIYVVAGHQLGHSSGHVPWLDSFNPKTGEWQQLADAPRARDHFQAVVLDGKMYAVAGRRSAAATGNALNLTTPESTSTTSRWERGARCQPPRTSPLNEPVSRPFSSTARSS